MEDLEKRVRTCILGKKEDTYVQKRILCGEKIYFSNYFFDMSRFQYIKTEIESDIENGFGKYMKKFEFMYKNNNPQYTSEYSIELYIYVFIRKVLLYKKNIKIINDL